MIVEPIRVITRRHHLCIQAVRATSQPLDDIVDLFAVQELLDPGVDRRHSHLHGPSCLASLNGRAGRPGASGMPGAPDPGTPRITRRLGCHRWAGYPGREMKSLFDDGDKPPTLSERLSGMFSGAFARPPDRPPASGWSGRRDGPRPAPPGPIVNPADRRAAMTSLDATETKWSKAGLAIAAFIGAIIVVYLAADHPTKKVTDKVHGVTHTHLVPLSDSYYLVGAIVLVFCLLGFEGIRRQRRTLVVLRSSSVASPSPWSSPRSDWP